MFNRHLVTSGFDTETVVSENYLTYILLAQIEAGLLPLDFSIVQPGVDFRVLIHPPTDYERQYEAGAPLPEPANNSFNVELLPDDGSPVAALAFSPDATRLVTGSWDNVVRFWDVNTGIDLLRVTGHTGSISGVIYHPDGTRVVSSSVDGTVRLIEAGSGVELRVLKTHVGPVFGVAVSADGTTLVSCGADRTVRLADIETGAEVRVLIGHTGPVFCVAFSPDGTRVASGSLDGTVRLWDAVTGAALVTFTGHKEAVTSVVFSSDGTHIVSGSHDKTVRLWSIEDEAQVRKFSGHRGPVTSVAFRNSVAGAQIVSGSQDRTVRLWDVATGDEVRRLSGHNGPVLSIAFSPNGSRIASGSQDNTARLWNTATGAVVRRFTIPFMRLTLVVTVIDNTVDPPRTFPAIPARLLVNLDLVSDALDNGLERNHQLLISLARLDPDTADLLEDFGIDPQVVQDEVARQLDRSVPLLIAHGTQVQQIRMKKFVASQRSVGFYVDLPLRNGPEPDAFRASRGNVNLAQDFRRAESPLAFATSPGLFAMLGPDAKLRRAEETEPGSGEFRFPLRDPNDPDGEVFGKIKGISVGPTMAQPGNLPATPTGALMLDVHGEYTLENLPDPDFHLQLILTPKIENGLVEWDPDVDLDIGLLATLVAIGAGVLLTLLYAPGLAWGSTLLIGTIAGLAVVKGIIAEPLLSQYLAGRIDAESQASFLDPIPFRVPAAQRRWDPFYVTAHEVVTKVEEVVIDEQGIAFEGISLTLDKEPVPVDHVVIRDVERSPTTGAVEGLRYRVADFEQIGGDLTATGPGQDRLPFTRTDLITEPTLVTLSMAQIAERIEKARLVASIHYTPERIFVVSHEIDGLLCMSVRERNELTNFEIERFKEKVRDENRDEVRVEVIADLDEELGRPPTVEEINDEVRKRLDALIEEQLPDFIEKDLPKQLEATIEQALRFELPPEELAAVQLAGTLVLDGKEIITRHNADGTTTTYYRDKPDANAKDNLLALPHYASPYVPPQVVEV
jgi:WD40 repeat protein